MSTVETTPLVRVSLADRVYEILLSSILTGNSESGVELNVADLSRRLRVSPSPVREALLRLAADGLVTIANHRRATVIRYSRQEIIEVFEVRQLLESGATRMAARRISPDELAQLKQAALDCAALAGDSARKREMLELDNQFHLLIAQACGNQRLADEITGYGHRVRVIQWLQLPPARMDLGLQEHLAIHDALAAGNPQQAQQAMCRHLENALSYVLESIPDNAAPRQESV